MRTERVILVVVNALTNTQQDVTPKEHVWISVFVHIVDPEGKDPKYFLEGFEEKL